MLFSWGDAGGGGVEMFGEIPFESPKHKNTFHYPHLFPAVITWESTFHTKKSQG